MSAVEVLAEAGAVYGLAPEPVPSDAAQTQQEEFGEYALRHLKEYGYAVIDLPGVSEADSKRIDFLRKANYHNDPDIEMLIRVLDGFLGR